MDREDVPSILQRLEAHRARHAERGLVLRALWVLAGFAVLLAGLVMLVTPGPAVVVIPLGLAMLSFEFAWAERLLERSVRGGLRARRAAGRRRTLATALGAVLVLAAAAAASLLYF